MTATDLHNTLPTDLDRHSQSANTKRHQETLRAHRVLGSIIETLPPRVRMHSWALETDSRGTELRIQHAVTIGQSDAAIRASLRSVATLLELAYTETRRSGHIEVSASGELGGVQVIIWDHVKLTNPCDCGCHATGGATR